MRPDGYHPRRIHDGLLYLTLAQPVENILPHYVRSVDLAIVKGGQYMHAIFSGVHTRTHPMTITTPPEMLAVGQIEFGALRV